MQVLIYSAYYTQHQELYHDIFEMTRTIEDTYPNYRDWYYKTFLTDLKNGNRLYALATHHRILSGCCLMKNTPYEKKICTLFVAPQFRRQGVGTDLMHAAFKELGPTPFLTVSSAKIGSFRPFLDRFGFQMRQLPSKGDNTPAEVLFYRPAPRQIQKAHFPPLNREHGRTRSTP